MTLLRRSARLLSMGLATAAILVTAGCQLVRQDDQKVSLNTLNDRIDVLSAELKASREALHELRAANATNRHSADVQLARLTEGMQTLPERLDAFCESAGATAACEGGDRIQRVVVSADKMLVGALEYVWIDPPGISAVARIDTGATSSSLHADNVVRFERDSDDWVRFDLILDDSEPVTMERRIVRHARVIQQADPDGSRRPIVEMRVRLGDVQGVFEFSLADRSHLQNEIILGRNFLTDLTLVDVGKQFIQPRYSP